MDVLIEHQLNGVTYVTLNRLDKHNALNEQLINDLRKQLELLDKDEETKIIILSGNGKNFSAGADLEYMKKMMHYSTEENVLDAMNLATLFKVLSSLSKPTIGLAKGTTLGGGVGLLACCDIVIAQQDAHFCFSEARLGLIPATIAPYIVHALGPRATKYLFLTAKVFNAVDAQQFGLVQEIVANDFLDEAAKNLSKTLLANGPQALKNIKRWLAHLNPFNDQIMIESAELIAQIRASNEAQEGIQAFFEKQPAPWIK